MLMNGMVYALGGGGDGGERVVRENTGEITERIDWSR